MRKHSGGRCRAARRDGERGGGWITTLMYIVINVQIMESGGGGGEAGEGGYVGRNRKHNIPQLPHAERLEHQMQLVLDSLHYQGIIFVDLIHLYCYSLLIFLPVNLLVFMWIECYVLICHL